MSAPKGGKARKKGEAAKPAEQKEPARGRGRESQYDQDTAVEICTWIADGKSLKSYCRQEGKPDIKTVYRWMFANEDFRHQYAQAREDQADTLTDELLDIADDGSLDPQDRRVRIDTRKWIASKLKPKVYGDKVTNEHTGKDGGPLTTETTVIILPSNSRDSANEAEG